MDETNFEVYTFGQSDPNENLAIRFFKAKTIKLNNISIFKILTCKTKFASAPVLNLADSPINIIKRKLIKILGLTIEKDIEKKSLEEIQIVNHGGMVLFCPGKVASEIYSIHCPQMKTVEIYSRFNHDALHISNPINIDNSPGITVFINPPSSNLLLIYRKLHPNKKIIVRLHDWIGYENSDLHSLAQELNKLRHNKIIDNIESYSRKDSAYLNAIYRPNGANGCYLSSIDPKFRSSLVIFLGTSSNANNNFNRAKTLKLLKSDLKSIYPTIGNWIRMSAPKNLKNRISYARYLAQSATAEVFIDLVRITYNEGFSFRIPEALFLNRKIITDRADIIEEKFFSSERVYIIGAKNKYNLKTFLEIPTPPALPRRILNLFDSTLWWTKDDPYIN